VKNLRHEHAVPKKVVVGTLLKLKNPTEKDVDLWFKFLIGVVTKEEDKLLKSRFKSSMPPEFYNASSPSWLDMLIRYKHLVFGTRKENTIGIRRKTP
jgi:hypothetical protein